jgi:hypothetical protein
MKTIKFFALAAAAAAVFACKSPSAYEKLVDEAKQDAAVKALEAEALRVVESMPKWNPGMQGGKPVNTQYVLPIMFRLS